MKYAVVTFGCRVNQADSFGIEEALLASGAQPASPDAADLVVVNTCSVTTSADQGARQTIRRVARSNPSARIVVTGCYASRRPEEVAALPNVLRVVRNDDKPRLVDLVQADPRVRPVTAGALAGRYAAATTADRFGDGDGACGAAIEPGVAGRTAFTLRVQTGCAEPCSYCIIPATRGEPRSVPLDVVLREIERVAAAGFKEIALTGVHLGSYGRDLTPRSSLLELLQALSAVAQAFRPTVLLFRISSLEPMDCTPDIVRFVAEHTCFAPHFHLPLQHASACMLAAMRRPYSISQYAELVEDISERIPNASIGSDVIVGFPGETVADFELLAAYLERSPLTHLHVFPYSDRPGTAAVAMPDKVHGSVVRARAQRLRQISTGLADRFRQSQIGVEHRALTLEDGSLVVTGNYLKLRIPPGRARNEWVLVRMVDRERGELVNS